MRFLLVSIFLSLFGISEVQAYPDFIGYGYRSCLICHESGTGGGALTDYGRGVFSSEIAANPLRKWISDDEAAEISNFLGPVEFPFWLRMGFKYRTLTVEASPGSDQSQKIHYNMQNDFNLNLFANEAHTIGLITTFGYVENRRAIYPHKTFKEDSYTFVREYFLKMQLGKEFWFNLGLMDKAFGIKTANHTAVNRAQQGLGQNDQVHSAQLQWARKDEDLFFQYWIGNLGAIEDERLTGGSFMLDKKWGGNHAYGVNLLSEKKKSLKRDIFALHNKMGFSHGNSILMEGGYRIEDISFAASVQNKKSYYLFAQNNLNITRGYFFTSSIELAKVLSDSTNSDAKPENLKWDIGLLAFPLPRMELRFSGINQKTVGATEAVKDQWAIQSQIHLSL